MSDRSITKLVEWIGDSNWKAALFEEIRTGTLEASLDGETVILSSSTRNTEPLSLSTKDNGFPTIAWYVWELPKRYIAFQFFRTIAVPKEFFREDVVHHLFHDPSFHRIRQDLEQTHEHEYKHLVDFREHIPLELGFGGDDGTYYRMAETILLAVLASGFYEIAKYGIRRFVLNRRSKRTMKRVAFKRLEGFVYGNDAPDYSLELILKLPSSRKRRVLRWLACIVATDVSAELKERLKSLKKTEETVDSIVDDLYGHFL